MFGNESEDAETLSELLDRIPGSAESEADRHVRRAESVDELVERLEGLVESRDEETPGEDATVAGTESLSALRPEVNRDDAAGGPGDADPVRPLKSGVRELRERVPEYRSRLSEYREQVPEYRDRLSKYRNRGDGDDGGDLPESDPSDGEADLVPARSPAGVSVAEFKRTLRDADPGEVALWGLGIGIALANPAIAAGYSTTALLSGAVVGGGVLGAYKSSRETTVLDDVDPLQLARRANGTAASGRGLKRLDGEAAGALLGASTYLAEATVPEAYAHWIAEADVDSVLEGAELGAAYAQDAGGERRRAGAAFGGTVGLLRGYADAGVDDGTLRELLDEDLYREYIRGLPDGGS